MNTLGNKIRVFRKLKGLSQLDLELAIGASTGTISRIENNDTNPSKETILKIAKVLGLNHLELDYLIGYIAEPATIEEINKARVDVKEFMCKKGTLAYVVDDRSRMIDISDTFCKLGKLPPKETFLLNPMIKLTFNQSYGIRKNLNGELFYKTAFQATLRNYQETYFMEGDPVYQEMMEYLKINEEANAVWNDVKNYYDKYNVRHEDTREVFFSINGVKVKMIYSVEPLWSDHRFRILQYTPDNYIAKLLIML